MADPIGENTAVALRFTLNIDIDFRFPDGLPSMPAEEVKGVITVLPFMIHEAAGMM